jgi:hypothetical protein
MPFLLKTIRVEQVGDVLWKLLATVVYLGRYGTYTVPVGYLTDFASVPRWLWWFTPQSGRWNGAAIVHDWLITNGLLGEIDITSPQVDAEFRHALHACGVGLIRRWLMWAGVRWAAVANPVRRPGWLCTLPLLLLVSATALAPLAAVLLVVL